MSSDTDVDASHFHHDRHARCCEGKFANGIIQVTQSMLCTPLAVLWIILVIVTGAIFFFFLCGLELHDARKEEKWLNYSIQALNVLFTYAAIANEPKRARDFIRLWRMRGQDDGMNLEGNVSTEIHDYIPYRHRMFIIINLNLNCIFQYINQTFRAIYWTFEEAQQHVWEVNLFFALSFLCAIIAPIYQYIQEQHVRKEGKAPPGEELSPLQKFMQRTDFSYREVGIESYDYAIRQLNKRLKGQTQMKQEQKKDAKKTDRTAAAGESQLSLYSNSAVDFEANDGTSSNDVLSTLDCDETRANCEVAIGESLPV
jgi:hypothetical protein